MADTIGSENARSSMNYRTLSRLTVEQRNAEERCSRERVMCLAIKWCETNAKSAGAAARAAHISTSQRKTLKRRLAARIIEAKKTGQSPGDPMEVVRETSHATVTEGVLVAAHVRLAAVGR